ncbi:ATP-binding cassette subfamily B protein [Sinorhizobium kostiense]|uniref:ATP-binding cassette subfamily B protein n=1 Tax=Sinorhizobium kostiense TaxID=76747 RepID=A0ABS4QXD0_9HYPH|nr:ABC transporter ATP-binding protein [Sinorhizobium kostiense]MBP2235308.1 ATP-binding cassette subfamily B protein [Sinorhizobium kostiense]
MLSCRYSDVDLFRRLLSQAAPHRLHLLGILLIGLLWSPIALLTPLPLKIAVDSAVGAQPLPGSLGTLLPVPAARPLAALAVAVGLAVALAIVGQVRNFADSLLRTYTGEQLTLAFRARLFRHAQRLPLAYHDRNGSFDATHRILSDAPCVQWVTIYGIIPVLTASVTLIGMIYVTAVIDWQLAAVALAVSPIIFLLSRVHSQCVRPCWDQSRELEGGTLSIVQEVLSVLRVVKAFGREGHETERFARRSRRVIATNVRIAAINGGFDLLKGLTIALGAVTVLAIGVLHVRAGILTLGELLLVIGYVWQILGPVHTITNSLSSLQVAFAAGRRAFGLLDQPADADDRPDARPLGRAGGAVEFRDVCFGYDEGRPALYDVSFRVAPGTRVGIVGPTGSGKTTLVNLLIRFYDPSHGAILLDGVDLRDYRLADLRNQFAIVLQEPVLFSASIAENIAYGRPDATHREIVEAAKSAQAHDFIAGLPEGYDTQVGERGMSLSGGERQRISLARAFLRDAPILILDEPTSSVDVRTEGAIVDVLGRLMEGRTTFIIAHRLSTLMHCDAQIRIHRGRLGTAEREGPIDTVAGVLSLDGVPKAQHSLLTHELSSSSNIRPPHPSTSHTRSD